MKDEEKKEFLKEYKMSLISGSKDTSGDQGHFILFQKFFLFFIFHHYFLLSDH